MCQLLRIIKVFEYGRAQWLVVFSSLKIRKILINGLGTEKVHCQNIVECRSIILEANVRYLDCNEQHFIKISFYKIINVINKYSWIIFIVLLIMIGSPATHTCVSLVAADIHFVFRN